MASKIHSWSSGGRSLLLIFAIGGFGGIPSAVAAPEVISIEIDQTAGAAPAKRESAKQVERLEKTPLICLKLRIKLDGTDANALRSSFQEQDANPIIRRSVECGPAATGSLQMGSGVEYYYVTRGSAGNRIDLSIYPGSRTEHIANDIACEFDAADSRAAWFVARGIYQPIANRYADVGADGKANGKAILAIQLRPVPATRQDTDNCPQ